MWRCKKIELPTGGQYKLEDYLPTLVFISIHWFNPFRRLMWRKQVQKRFGYNYLFAELMRIISKWQGDIVR